METMPRIAGPVALALPSGLCRPGRLVVLEFRV